MENLPLRYPSFVHIPGHLFLKFHSLSKRSEPICTSRLNIQPFGQPMASHHPKLNWHHFLPKHCSGTLEIWADPIAAAIERYYHRCCKGISDFPCTSDFQLIAMGIPR
uniref:Uncharacterized protein n=1 Tax=Glossina pallidipes TaxID=7398 RepID=A0A1B0A3Y6_GLOPL